MDTWQAVYLVLPPDMEGEVECWDMEPEAEVAVRYNTKLRLKDHINLTPV